jgi:hypothetical protein
MLQSKLALAFLVACLATSCRKNARSFDYSDYSNTFRVGKPDKERLLKAWGDDSESTRFFEFSMSAVEYSELSKLLETKGYSKSKLLDGQFGKWEALNSSGNRVFGQSKVTDFGNAYYFYEDYSSRVTAIARYTVGR